jgi:hypothetical protein
MATRKRTIPEKDTDFNDAQKVIATKAIANIGQWGLDAQWMATEFIPASQQWEDIWQQYKDPETRTSVITFEKNEARKKYEHFLRFLILGLEYNPLVSDDDLAKMEIHRKSSKRTPVDIPNHRPGLKVISSELRIIVIAFFNILTGRRGKPTGVHGIEFRWAILEAYPTDIEQLIHSYFDTRSPFTLEFKESERGKIVYYCARWENTRGEKGPWSEIMEVIVP